MSSVNEEESRGAGAETRPGPAFELTDELRGKLGSVGTATLSAQLRTRGLNATTIDGVHPLVPGSRLLGRARTLRFVPFREDLSERHGNGYNAQKRAFDGLEPGDVLVVEARGELGTGTIGDILALRAVARGAAGFVSDGGVRDSRAVAATGLPVWAAGVHPAVLGRRHVPWDADLTIACGGCAVQPGDVIVGDDDGVVVIPAEIAEAVAGGAVQQEDEEAFIAEQVATGHAIDGLYPLQGEWRARYDTARGRSN